MPEMQKTSFAGSQEELIYLPMSTTVMLNQHMVMVFWAMKATLVGVIGKHIGRLGKTWRVRLVRKCLIQDVVPDHQI